ncbi:MAG: 1-(5-phosphoribosyl)-5-[(5-phosphoribosylamino)methylideneamino]imidazole-4-carboxamide isomerase [Thiolinea sp.]
MLLIPAIDLKDGQCVRLRQGRMEDSTLFSDSPVDMAARWVEAGARRLHLVDLNGAFEGKPVNGEVVRAVAERFPQVPVQIGGGIRDAATVQAYLDAGVQYCIIGTKAVQEPAFVVEVCRQFPGHIIVGIDARNGMVATDGWAEVSAVAAIDLARQFEQAGVSAIVYTDIARDGMMQGVNVEETARLAQSISIPVIASGGVDNLDDIRALCAVEEQGVMGAILAADL